MSWSTPGAQTLGTLITAATWNACLVDNPIALYGGAWALSGQAQYDLFYATDAGQFARLANGTTGQSFRHGSPPRWGAHFCSVYHNTTQTVTAAATALAFNSEASDADGLHVAGQSRITIAAAGTYLVAGRSGLTPAGGYIWIRVNGYLPAYALGVLDDGRVAHLRATAMIDLSVGDYVELGVQTHSGSESWGSGTYREEMSELIVAQI